MRKFILTRWLCCFLLILGFMNIDVSGRGKTSTTLQLYSYNTTNPPKINGVLTDGTNDVGVSGTNNDEWQDAYVRTIKLTDGNEATLFITNNADSLYIGISYPHGNNGSPNGVVLYFDQGASGGSHDGILTGSASIPNENAVFSDRGAQGDSTWNGTAWVADAGALDLNVANDYFTTVFHWEFAIPLRSAKSGDLAVDSTDELGFLIAINKNGGGGGVFYWDSTNSDPTDASGWADLQLGVLKKFTTFYSSYKVNGIPDAINGVIKGGTATYVDDAWRGSYQRSITLINFAGSTINAILYSIDDFQNDKFYVGFRINDADQNNGDYLRIYQEEDFTTPADAQDYVLDDEKENMLAADENAFDSDYFWDADAPAWTDDGEAKDQDGVGDYHTDHYEYEFEVGYNLGARDLALNDGAKMGFLVRYHDADQPAGKQDYYWEYTTNSDAVLLDETASPAVYGAIGWATMQLGAPYVQIIFPEDDKDVEGVVNVRIYAQDENIDGIVSAIFYRKSVPTTTYTLTRIDMLYEWSGTWNVLSLPDGPDTLVFEVTDDEGITVERLVNVTIQNETGTVVRPTARIVSPTPGDSLSGSQTITFTKDPGSGTKIANLAIFIDGDSTGLDTGATDHLIVTNDYLDGAHTIQIQAINDAGMDGISPVATYHFRNAPSVTLTSPTPDSVLSGTVIVAFHAQAIPMATIAKREIYVDGGLVDTATTDSTYIWNTLNHNDGQHILQVVVTDSKGKVGKSALILVTIMNSPVVQITAPAPGEALAGIYTVLFTITPVTSAIIVSREVSIDGGDWTDSLVGTMSYVMSTVGWEDGSHSIQVRGKDNKGRIGNSNIRMFVVDNSPPILADPQVIYPEGAQSTKIDTTVLITVLAKDIIVGLKSDSAVILSSDFLDPGTTVTYVMVDNGQNGDLVANDNIFSATVIINTDTTGTIGYSITAEDVLGNSVTIISAIQLDNTPPVVSPFEWVPVPEASTLPGDVTYFDKLILKGTYSDEGGSGLSRVFISVKNDSGNNVNNSPIELSSQDSIFSRIVNVVPGENYITLEAKDNAGNKASRYDTINYIEPKATKVVGKNGGTVQSPNGVSVVIPQYALLKSKEITITKVDPIDEADPVNTNVRLLNVAHDFGPDGLTFRKPVTITLSYTEADLDIDQDGVNNFDPSKFTVVFWDGETWLNAGKATVNFQNRLVSVSVNHFTTFDIAELTTQTPTELITYWTHNPVKSLDGSYFNYELPEAGTVSLAIVDLAGDLVYQLIARGTPKQPGRFSVGWRGQNVAERFAGAGLYVYVFIYTKYSASKPTIIRKPIGLLK